MEKGQTEGWTAVYKSGTDYAAEFVCNRLKDADIPAVILNHRDHAWNLTHGYLAKVSVMVPSACLEEASALLEAEAFTEEELARMAMEAAADKKEKQ